MLDATTEMSLQAIAPTGVLTLECDEPVKCVDAKVVSLYADEPCQRTVEVSAYSNATRSIIDLSSLGPLEASELRRAVFVRIKTKSKRIVDRVKLVVATPKDVAVAD